MTSETKQSVCTLFSKSKHLASFQQAFESFLQALSLLVGNHTMNLELIILNVVFCCLASCYICFLVKKDIRSCRAMSEQVNKTRHCKVLCDRRTQRQTHRKSYHESGIDHFECCIL